MSQGKQKWKHVTLDWSFDVKQLTDEVRKAVELGMHDCIDDLIRTSSECAPHDYGILEKSWAKDANWSGDKFIGTVTYSVSEQPPEKANKEPFNYALWTHEEDYELGEKSKQKPGGVGMSGKSYEVGKGYLTRPLYGEEETYKQHIQNMIDKAVK